MILAVKRRVFCVSCDAASMSKLPCRLPCRQPRDIYETFAISQYIEETRLYFMHIYIICMVIYYISCSFRLYFMFIVLQNNEHSYSKAEDVQCQETHRLYFYVTTSNVSLIWNINVGINILYNWLMLLRDFSSFDIILLHLKLQTCFTCRRHYNFI